MMLHSFRAKWMRQGGGRVVSLFAVSAGALLISAPPSTKPILETEFLVIPNRAFVGSGVLPQASDFRATVGKEELQVRSVTPAAGSPDLKTIVVFDLASVPPDYQPCFIQQVKALAPDLRRISNVALYVVSYECTELHGAFGHGPGEEYEYFLPDPNANGKDMCASLPPPRPAWGWPRGWSERAKNDPNFRFQSQDTSVLGGGLATIRSFRGLAEALESMSGPVRVLWVGQRFEWVRPGYANDEYTYGRVLAGKLSLEPGWTPNAACDWLDAFTRSGISFWPVMWLDGESVQGQGPKRSLEWASEIAKYLGGQATVCERDVAACLNNILDTTSHGLVVRIAGPEVGWPDRYTPQQLRLWYEPDSAVLDAQRPFVRLAMPIVHSAGILIWHTLPPVTPLFDSVWLKGKAGCSQGAAGPVTKYEMAALVPDAVANGLQSYVEVLGLSPGAPEKKLSSDQERAAVLGDHMRLRVRGGPEVLKEIGQGTTEVCVELPAPGPTDKSYRVILFNREAGWAGVGVLSAADVLRQREGP